METFSTILALCEGNSAVTSEFPSQSPVTWSFDVLFDCTSTNGWVNNWDSSDLPSHHYDITVMGRQEPVYPRWIILWLLMTRPCKQSKHQQPLYFHSYPKYTSLWNSRVKFECEKFISMTTKPTWWLIEFDISISIYYSFHIKYYI